MRNEAYYTNTVGSTFGDRLSSMGIEPSRKTAVGAILIIALLAFETFNFDTTRYALRDLLGEVEFLSLQWASILAIAFCSIDFAGLVRLFTPERGMDEPKEVWYLMGAWLLGATMNAVMTWWAISLTLLNNDFGNEIMSREQLLKVVPIFVAVLVWLTRILFIGAFSVAGEHIFDLHDDEVEMQPVPRSLNNQRKPAPKQRTQPASTPPLTRPTSPKRTTAKPAKKATPRSANKPRQSAPKPMVRQAQPKATVVSKPKPKPKPQLVNTYSDEVPGFLDDYDFETVIEPQATLLPPQTPLPPQNPRPFQQKPLPKTPQSAPQEKKPQRQQPTSRVRQRPPKPNGGTTVRRVTPPRHNSNKGH